MHFEKNVFISLSEKGEVPHAESYFDYSGMDMTPYGWAVVAEATVRFEVNVTEAVDKLVQATDKEIAEARAIAEAHINQLLARKQNLLAIGN
jgi:hypothetical protein